MLKKGFAMVGNDLCMALLIGVTSYFSPAPLMQLLQKELI